VRDLGLVAAGDCVPWRHFTWRTGQRHRPGLQFLVSTGRHHGFESLGEQRFLLALQWQKISAGDWTAYAAEVSRRSTPQPILSRHEIPGQA
jgi:hypothetical protein